MNIPFFRPSLLQRSLDEIKKQRMRAALHKLTGGLLGEDDA